MGQKSLTGGAGIAVLKHIVSKDALAHVSKTKIMHPQSTVPGTSPHLSLSQQPPSNLTNLGF